MRAVSAAAATGGTNPKVVADIGSVRAGLPLPQAFSGENTKGHGVPVGDTSPQVASEAFAAWFALLLSGHANAEPLAQAAAVRLPFTAPLQAMASQAAHPIISPSANAGQEPDGKKIDGSAGNRQPAGSEPAEHNPNSVIPGQFGIPAAPTLPSPAALAQFDSNPVPPALGANPLPMQMPTQKDQVEAAARNTPAGPAAGGNPKAGIVPRQPSQMAAGVDPATTPSSTPAAATKKMAQNPEELGGPPSHPAFELKLDLKALDNRAIADITETAPPPDRARSPQSKLAEPDFIRSGQDGVKVERQAVECSDPAAVERAETAFGPSPEGEQFGHSGQDAQEGERRGVVPTKGTPGSPLSAAAGEMPERQTSATSHAGSERPEVGLPQLDRPEGAIRQEATPSAPSQVSSSSSASSGPDRPAGAPVTDPHSAALRQFEAARSLEAQMHRPGPLQDIRIRVPDPASPVDIRLIDRGGQIEVSVRSADRGLASELNAGLPDLVRGLASNGYDASKTAGDRPASGSEVGQQKENNPVPAAARPYMADFGDPQRQQQQGRPRNPVRRVRAGGGVFSIGEPDSSGGNGVTE